VRRPSRADEAGVRLQVEVAHDGRCDAPVDDGAGGQVAGPVGLGGRFGVEAEVVALTTDDVGELRRRALRVKLAEGSLERRDLLVDDGVKLAFGNAVAVEDDALGLLVAVRLAVGPEQADGHGLQVLDHLDPAGLEADLSPVLHGRAIRRRDDGGDRRRDRIGVAADRRVRDLGKFEQENQRSSEL
jgi:hypothetical protein